MQAVLGYRFRDEGAPHDCLTDAIIPMRIVLHVLEHRLKGRIVIQDTEVGLKYQLIYTTCYSVFNIFLIAPNQSL